MASETIACPTTSTDERVEKSIEEEVGAVSPSKVIEKEGNLESEVASASLSGSGDKKDNTMVELPVPRIPVSNELGTLVPEQVTDTDNNKSNEMPTIEPTEEEELTQKKVGVTVVDKQEEDEPIVVVVDASEASIEATEKLEQTKRTPVSKISEPEPETVIKAVNKSQEESEFVEQVEKEENKPDETPTTEPIEEHKQEEPAGQSVNKQALEQPVVVDDASIASIEAKEKLEVQSKSTTVGEIPEPVLEANNKSQKESVVMEQVEKSDKQKERGVEQSGAMEKPEKQSKIASVSEIPEPLHKVVNNPQEQSLVNKQFEEDSGKVELNELVEDGAVMKDASSEEHTSKDEEPEPQKQIPRVEGEQADKGSERVELLESAEGETTKNEGILSIQTKETPVTNEDQISEGEQPNPSEIVHQVSKDIEISALTEELTGSIVDKVENLISSVSTKDAAGNPAGMDNPRRDLTLVTEDKQEETPTSIETSKVGDVGESLDEVSESEINVEAKESPGKELQEAKGEDTLKAGPGKQEKEKEVKDDDGSQTSQNPAKEQAPPKPIQRNILSKVKQSLAKAKRVITGKSPSSKAPSSDSKGENDIKVK